MKNIMVDDGIAPSSGIKLTFFLSNLFVSNVDLYIKVISNPNFNIFTDER